MLLNMLSTQASRSVLGGSEDRLVALRKSREKSIVIVNFIFVSCICKLLIGYFVNQLIGYGLLVNRLIYFLVKLIGSLA